MASLISWMIVSNLPSKTLFNLFQETPSLVRNEILPMDIEAIAEFDLGLKIILYLSVI